MSKRFRHKPGVVPPSDYIPRKSAPRYSREFIALQTALFIARGGKIQKEKPQETIFSAFAQPTEDKHVRMVPWSQAGFRII